MKVAISGKGGVGKTTIMALLAKQFIKEYNEVLVIDADPSPHMAQTLGIIDPVKTIPISEMKDLLTERSGKTKGSSFYNINPKINDLPERFMLEKDGLRLMIIGAIQTGDSGCACAENTVLRRLLVKMLLKPKQAVLLDMEAGVEHLGRGTIAGIDHLLIVAIPSNSSVRTALKIQTLAKEVGIPKISFIGNSLRDPEDLEFLEQSLQHKVLATFPDSREIRNAERQKNAIADLANLFEPSLKQIIDGLST